MCNLSDLCVWRRLEADDDNDDDDDDDLGFVSNESSSMALLRGAVSSGRNNAVEQQYLRFSSSRWLQYADAGFMYTFLPMAREGSKHYDMPGRFTDSDQNLCH